MPIPLVVPATQWSSIHACTSNVAGLESRLLDHFDQHGSGCVTISNFSQKSHPPAVNSVASLHAEMEAQAIDGGHGSLVGSFACKPAGNQHERIGVISIHVLDDSRRNLGERIWRSGSVVPGRDPSHHAKASDEVNVRDLEPVIRKVGV